MRKLKRVRALGINLVAVAAAVLSTECGQWGARVAMAAEPIVNTQKSTSVVNTQKPTPSVNTQKPTSVVNTQQSTPNRDTPAPAIDEVLQQASAAYAEAINARDYKALAEQWTLGAQLVEGGSLVQGRERIAASIREWLQQHPQATVKIRLTDSQPLGPTLARVRGIIEFTRKPGEKSLESRFESLRVMDDGQWRLAESHVTPSQVAALEELGWLMGTWLASDEENSTSIEASFEKILGGHAILGRTKIKPKSGPVIDAIDMIHADTDSGTVRSWVFDSTGARAEGFFETDGASFNRSFTGTTADGVADRVAEWVQVLTPMGDGKLMLQSIHRSLDGQSLPDRKPLYFRKLR